MRHRLVCLLLVLSTLRAVADPQASLQAVVNATVTDGVTGAALVVDDPARGHFAVAAGLADTATRRVLHPTDRFRIASISKTFTAAATLLLRDDGRVDLDVPIKTYLPEHDIPNSGLITLRMLLTHTSGMADCNNDSSEFGAMLVANPTTIITREMILALLRRLPVHFAPGAAWKYSDTGYYLLALVVEKRNAQGWTFGQFVQNRLLTPLGLDNTFVPTPDNNYLLRIPGTHAHGYVAFDPAEPPVDMTELNQSWDIGSGGMVSTLEDLARWVRLLYSGQVLSARSTAEMKTMTPQSRASVGASYGMATVYRLTTGYGHGGATSGYLCEMQYEPVHRTASAGFINLFAEETLNVTKPLMVAAKRALGYPEQMDPGYARLANASGRGLAGAGEEALVLGFTFGGAESKSMIVRAAGPTLRNFGVTSALADPRVQVSARSGTTLANDNWDGRAETTAACTQVGAFLFPAGSKDAAIVSTLAPGDYSATVASVDGASGVALAEVYDPQALAAAPSRLRNVSVRGRVGTAEAMLTAGFVVLGNAPLRVLIRGVGPTLTSLGVARATADPQIVLYSGATALAQNDNWDGSPAAVALFAQIGAFTLPAGSKDAVIVATLNPGAYTVGLRGASTSDSGVALIEIYDAQPAPDYAPTRQQVKDYIQRRMRETGVVGVSVALVDSDGVILQEGFGYRDPAKAQPVTVDTPFSIGSVSKTMAAAMIMQLVAEGKLDLDAPLRASLPEFAITQRFPASAPISLRSILAHHSGLPGDLFNGAFSTMPIERWNDYLLASLSSEYTQRPVGEMWAYNNSGYVLLQNVIERASGLSLADYSHRGFFAPAGMERSTFGHDAPGWSATFSDGEPLPTEYVNAGTAGSVKSSTAEMARYLRLLIHEGIGERGRVLPPSFFRQMTERQYPGNPFDEFGGIRFGLGFRVGLPAFEFAGGSFGHDGETVAFHSQMIVLNDQGLAVFVSSNTESPDTFADEAAREILRIALENLRGLTPPMAPPAPPAPMITKTRAELATYAGLYSPGFGGYDKIVATDTGLQWTRGAGGSSPATTLLLPRTDGRFAPAGSSSVQLEFRTVAGRALAIVYLAGQWWTDHYILGEKLAPSSISPAWRHRAGDYIYTNLWPIDYRLLYGDDVTQVRLEIRDGLLMLGEDVIVPVSDTLAFTAGIGFGVGRNRGDAVRIETSGGVETLWVRGQTARRVAP